MKLIDVMPPTDPVLLRLLKEKAEKYNKATEQEKIKKLENMSSEDRKNRPIARGVLDYFPDALAEVAYVSKVGNDQHNPGQPLHWAKEKSTDHADCILRHLIDRGKFDKDGMRHSAKVAWRALALLQTEIENERNG